MWRFIRVIFIWIVILLFLFFLYNHFKNDRIEYLGEDAPMPTELHPIVEENKNIFINRTAEQNIQVIITEETRSFERQDALYEQGRTAEGNIVTYAQGGESYHNYGLAIDYALMDENGDITWNIEYDGNGNGEPDWFEAADIAKELGFEWGGDWQHFKDYPHLQMTFGLSINQLQRGFRPTNEIDTE